MPPKKKLIIKKKTTGSMEKPKKKKIVIVKKKIVGNVNKLEDIITWGDSKTFDSYLELYPAEHPEHKGLTGFQKAQRLSDNRRPADATSRFEGFEIIQEQIEKHFNYPYRWELDQEEELEKYYNKLKTKFKTFLKTPEASSAKSVKQLANKFIKSMSMEKPKKKKIVIVKKKKVEPKNKKK